MTACLTLQCPGLPLKSRRCHCAGCHRFFSGVSAFDMHQHLPDGGTAVCLDPAARGLVSREAGGATVWGWPERETDWTRKRRGQTA